jgi:hypothetical protein
MRQAMRAGTKGIRLTGGPVSAHHHRPAIEPPTGYFAQRREEVRRLPMQEHQAVVHGLAFDSAGRAPAAHPTGTLKQAHGLPRLGKNLGAGKPGYARPNDKHIKHIGHHGDSMPLAHDLGQDSVATWASDATLSGVSTNRGN